MKGNLKQFLRLTVASRPPLPVLGIKKAILDKAGLPDFASVLREGGYQAMDSKNTRLAKAKADHKLCVLYLLFICIYYKKKDLKNIYIGLKVTAM